MRAEFFMEELDNGVKLCQLIGALQAKMAVSCPSALGTVSQPASMVEGWGWGGTSEVQLARLNFLLLQINVPQGGRHANSSIFCYGCKPPLLFISPDRCSLRGR